MCLAIDLARSDLKVALLEAGGRTLANASQSIFRRASWSGYPLEGLHVGRFRALGGTTNFWGGQLAPFDSVVFEERPWVADARWPVTHSNLQPHYSAAYQMLGVTALSDAEVWERLASIPPNLPDELEVFFTRWAPEPNLARLFRPELTTRTNLHVYLNSPVVGLAPFDRGERVAPVILRSGGQRQVLHGRHIVLANGTVEMARLMMLPLEGGAVGPWSENPWLGRGFMDHIDAFAGDVKPISRAKFDQAFDNAFVSGIKHHPKIKLSEQAQRSHRLVGVAAHFVYNSAQSEHIANLKILVRGLLRGRFEKIDLRSVSEFFELRKIVLPMATRYLRYRRMYNPADKGIQLRLTTEQIPLRTSRLTLRRDVDELEMPCVNLDWHIDGSELDTMARFATSVRDALRGASLADIDLSPTLLARDPAFLATIDDANHQMGMVRMAGRESDGVTDANLRVFGCDNLFAAGAAVFPTSGFSNPTLTAIALGLRLSTHLKGLCQR